MQLTENVSLSTKNFTKQNTPPLIQKIGDYALMVGAVGLTIIGLPAVLPAAIIASIPAVIFTAGGWAAAVGFGWKLFSKNLGTTPPTITSDIVN